MAVSEAGAGPVPFTRLLDGERRPVDAVPAFAADRETHVSPYRGMVRTQSFDAKAVALQRTGWLGTYASSLGQKAVAVGIGAATRAEDVLLPSFREHGTQLWCGLAMTDLLLFWVSDERGSAAEAAREDFPVSIAVASHFPHAAGIALTLQLRGEARAAVAVAWDARRRRATSTRH